MAALGRARRRCRRFRKGRFADIRRQCSVFSHSTCKQTEFGLNLCGAQMLELARIESWTH